MATVVSEKKQGGVQNTIETQIRCDSPNFSSVCDQLVLLGRRRNQIMRRQRLTNQPAEQDFKYELSRMSPDSKLTSKQWYKKAQEVRKQALKAMFGGWGEYLDMMLNRSEVSVDLFKRRYREETGCLTPEEAAVACLAQDVVTDRQSLEAFRKQRKDVEGWMEDAVKRLPVCEWWCSIRGCNCLGLAIIIAETGDLSKYANPGKVWKRLGLAPVKEKSCSTWRKEGGLTAGDWVSAGYCPRRRSVVWNVGEALIKNNKDGEYRRLFLCRKRLEIEKAEKEGLEVVTTTKATADAWEKVGLPRPAVVRMYDKKKHRGVAHIHNRAKRYMEKRLIRELWKVWRRPPSG